MTECVPCFPGCSNCIGPDESECMPLEAAYLVSHASSFSLPDLTETADNRICYRIQLPTSGCTPDPIESITGSINEYAGEAKPTQFQCYLLLTAMWPYVINAYNHLSGRITLMARTSIS